MTSPQWKTLSESLDGTPAALHATDPDVNRFAAWAREHHAELRAAVVKHGALHVRGLDAGEPHRFETVVRALEDDLKRDYLGTSPRDAVTDYVFHASELPGHFPIPQHIEMTFTKSPPTSIFFGCTIAPGRFGETPMCDFRKVARDLDARVAARFRTRGLKLVRNYGPPGVQNRDPWQLKPWADMFGTTDRAAVEARCATEGFEPTWLPDGGLRLTSFHSAFRQHAETGEEVWFNHLQVFHLSSAASEYRRITRLRPSVRNAGLFVFATAATAVKRRTRGPDEHAMHMTHADGGEIDPADVEHVRDTIWRHTVRVPWQKGDVVWIDNRSTSHGRMPYQGPREVIVAWS